MSQLAPVMLTAEQFNQLATKDYSDVRFEKMDKKINDLSVRMDERFDQIDKKFAKVYGRFDLLDYKIDSSVAQSYKDTNAALLNHEIRIKKLESKYI